MNKPHIFRSYGQQWPLKVPMYRLPDGTDSMYKTHISAKMVGSYLFSFTEFNYLLTFLKNITYRVN